MLGRVNAMFDSWLVGIYSNPVTSVLTGVPLTKLHLSFICSSQRLNDDFINCYTHSGSLTIKAFTSPLERRLSNGLCKNISYDPCQGKIVDRYSYKNNDVTVST